MKKFLFIIMALLLVSTISAATLVREIPSTVTGGQTFTVTYATSTAPTSKWFVAWDDVISGGCAPATFKNFMASETGGASSQTRTFTAPASGSCTFTGTYQFTGEASKSFATQTITVGTPCNPSTACAATTCSTTTCSNGCGGQVAGTKDCSGGDTNYLPWIIGGVVVLLLIVIMSKKR